MYDLRVIRVLEFKISVFFMESGPAIITIVCNIYALKFLKHSSMNCNLTSIMRAY